MKNVKKIMLIALIASIMLPMPQQAAAEVKNPEARIEKRERKPQRKPEKKPERQRPMRDNDFSMMYKIIKNSSFDNNKLDLIRVACIGSYFSSKQCARLLSLFSFDDNKIEVLKMMAPRLVDTENNNKIIKQISFPANKDKAINILFKH